MHAQICAKSALYYSKVHCSGVAVYYYFQHNNSLWIWHHGCRNETVQSEVLSSLFLARNSRFRSTICRQHLSQRAVLSHVHCFREWCLRSCWTVLSYVMRGHPGCLLQSTGEEANRILLASALFSTCAMCPNRVSQHDWIIAVSLGSLFLGVQSCTAIHRVPRRRMGERPLDIEVSCEISGFRPDE